MALQLPPPILALQTPLLHFCNILALAIGPQRRAVQILTTLPPLLLFAWQSVYREWDGAWGIHLALNTGVLHALFVYLDWILLGSPDREGWRKVSAVESERKGKKEKVDEDSSSSEEERKKDRVTAEKSFWARAWWGCKLACSFRHVGWSCQVKNVPGDSMKVNGVEESRLRFIARKTLRAAIFYLIEDAIYAYTAASPHGSWLDIAASKPALPIVHYPFWHRFWFAWVHVVLTCVSLEMMNTVCGIVAVATHLAAPSECPRAFGELGGMVRVRTAWGSTWHQMCRRICSAPGTFLARDILHLRRGSFASKYVQLFAGFFASGVVHAGGSMLCHRSFNDDGAMAFFMAQAVVVMLEDQVVDFGVSVGCREGVFWKAVGVLWTVGWIGGSLVGWHGRMVGHGMWVHERRPDWFGIGPVV